MKRPILPALCILIMSSGIAYAQTPPSAPPASQARAEAPKAKKLAIVLFDGFETLDVFGPVQMWGRLDDYELVTVSETGGTVTSSQGIQTVVAGAALTVRSSYPRPSHACAIAVLLL